MSELDDRRPGFWSGRFGAFMAVIGLVIVGLVIALLLATGGHEKPVSHRPSPSPAAASSGETIPGWDANTYQTYQRYALNTGVRPGITPAGVRAAQKVLCSANQSKDYYVKHIDGFLADHNALDTNGFVTDEFAFIQAYCVSPERLNAYTGAVQELGLTYVGFEGRQ
jgi:hypothetical protein